ncbi:MAG: hypothetical protein ACREDL_04195 [Bradyrhizobium sp.]
MQSVYTSSMDRKLFIPCMLSLPDEWRPRHAAPASSGSHTSRESPSDPTSPFLYIRKRGEGELAVREVFSEAILIRPAVMFGPDDAFLTAILKLLRQLPIYPMFGRGLTRLQPANVDDVAEAITRTNIKQPETIAGNRESLL